MRSIWGLIGIFIAIGVACLQMATPTWAASSSAIRTNEYLEVTTKDYSGQSLIGVQFNDATLEGANFSGADLRGAVFNGANLNRANFHGVDFSDGIAYISDLTGADLSDAILTSALMLKSKFRDANVNNADFSYAMLDKDQVLYLCGVASGVNPVTGVDTRESLGCP